MVLQILGKVRVALSPKEPEWAHITLYVTARGLTTGPVPSNVGAVRRGGRPARTTRSSSAPPTARPSGCRCAPARSRSSGPTSSPRCAKLGIDVELSPDAAGGAGPDPVPRRHHRTARTTPRPPPGSGACSRVDRAGVRRRTAPTSRARCRGCSSSGATPTSASPASPVSRAHRRSGRPARSRDLRLRADERRLVAGRRVVPASPRSTRTRYPKPDGIEDADLGVPGAAWDTDLGEFILDYDDVRAAPVTRGAPPRRSSTPPTTPAPPAPLGPPPHPDNKVASA